jgi:phenylacetate-CoA ligase
MIYFEYVQSELRIFCYTSDSSYIYKSSPIYGYVEVFKKDGSAANIGEICSIIVRGFNNRGMPFIQYDTCDLGKVSLINGGNVHFSKILEMSQDYVLSKNCIKIFLTALVFGQHIKAFKNIKMVIDTKENW